MSEMALTADHLLIIGRGRLLADTSLADLIARHSAKRVDVRAADAARLAGNLRAHGGEVTVEPDGALQVIGLSSVRIGEVAGHDRVRDRGTGMTAAGSRQGTCTGGSARTPVRAVPSRPPMTLCRSNRDFRQGGTDP
jgi:hypothetical protein